MDSDLQALLALQADDDIVDGIAERLDELAPRLAAMDAERERARKLLAQTEGTLEGEEKRRRELEQRLAEHRQKQERNVAQFDLVKRMKEAAAAESQVETGKKMVREGEEEVREASARIATLQRSLEEQREALAALEQAQGEAREKAVGERRALEAELAAARTAREKVASLVSPALRAKYDRIRGRRHSQAVFALVSGACSACDTALPLQKRNVMMSRREVDVCEACGVLLYATD